MRTEKDRKGFGVWKMCQHDLSRENRQHVVFCESLFTQDHVPSWTVLLLVMRDGSFYDDAKRRR